MGSELVALVDIGSNAARFALARVTHGVGYRVLQRARVVTRLAGGKPGTLPRKGLKAVLREAHRFLKEVRQGRDPRVVAVATSAVRDAKNSSRLLGPLRRKEGVEVEILSAREEARLGVLAAVESLSITDGAIVDLGGGSLQITRVRRGEPVSVHSLPLGSVRVTRRFLKHDPPTSKELRRLRQHVREQLLVAPPSSGRAEPLIAMGGTARAVASMHLAAERGRRTERHGLRLLPSELTAVRERLETLPERKRRKVRGLKADRAEIILAGVIVLEEVMAFGGYGSLVICTRGVADGILLRETFHRSA
jgi:exopolyphosphatase / guanosine-5'-triphosphate,3'-diphosphate pyrophosphatase